MKLTVVGSGSELRKRVAVKHFKPNKVTEN